MAAPDVSDYPAIVAQVQPPHAVAILNDRVYQIGRLNSVVVEWLKERRRLEEQYSEGLKRLARRNLEGLDLGIFSVPWATLTGSLDTVADAHSSLATKIEVDVERPLREFASTSRDMSNVTSAQGNLAALAKDVDKAQQKNDKLQGRGDRAESGRVANATSDLDSAQSSWDSQAPYIFESLQTLDETRVGLLRDAFTQYQTHEMDQLEKSRVAGEQCLNVLLNVETADEIKTFALKAVQSQPPQARAAPRSSAPYATPTRTSSAANALAPTTSRSEEDLPRERQDSADVKQKKGFSKGLRRLGTVVSRRRESKMPSNFSSTPETSESRPSAWAGLGGSRLGRSSGNTPTLSSLQEGSPQQRPGMPAQLGSEIFNSPSEVRADRATPPTSARDIGSLPQINGDPFRVSTIMGSRNFPNGSHSNDLTDLDPPKPIHAQRNESLRALEGQTDSEGYSVPPANLDPISQAQQEAAFADEGIPPPLNVNIRDAPLPESSAVGGDLTSAAQRLQAPPPSTKRTSTIRGRRTDRSSTIPNSAVVPEEQITPEAIPQLSQPETREISDSPVVSPTAPATQPTNVTDSGLSLSPTTTLTGGLAAAAAATSASAFAPFTPSGESTNPMSPISRSATGLDQLRGDNRSIRSAATSGSLALMKHPELTHPGLNSSIVETVGARFENGQLISSSLIGEIALAYNATDSSTSAATETIRLDNFSSLEKVAPNPAFVSATPARSGEYTIDLSSLPRTQVAFKYQIRVDADTAPAPLLVKPALRVEATQCSVIVSYALNPAFNLQGQESITLSNVMLALTIEGSKAMGCQSKPVGSFIREKSLIYWQLGDVTLSHGAAPEKLLARFATEAEATGASVEGRWEVTSASNSSLAAWGSALSVSMLSSHADPFADADEHAQAGGWKGVQGVRKLMSGSYVAK